MKTLEFFVCAQNFTSYRLLRTDTVFKSSHWTGIFLYCTVIMAQCCNTAYTVVQTMEDCGAFILRIDHRGESSYAFCRTCTPEGSTTRAHMQSLSCKGVGTMAAVGLNPGDAVYAERSSVFCVVGENENYVCKNCMVRVQKKVKVRADCNSLTYCSDQCLQAACDYLDICGPIIAKLQLVQDAAWKDTVHLLKLAINYLYALYTAACAHEVSVLLKVFELESHPDTPTPILQDAAAWLDASIGAAFPKSVLPVLVERGISFQSTSRAGESPQEHSHCITASRTLHTLLRVIKYNAQPLPVHGIQKVQLLALLPTVARVNHGCIPNCAPMYSVIAYQDVSADQSKDNRVNSVTSDALAHTELVCRYGVSVSLVALREIPAGEELVVSYLQPLCSSVDLRQTLLKQAFQFDCRCERCVADINGASTAATAARVSKLEQLLMRLSSGAGSATEVQLVELLDTAEQLATSTSTTAQGTVSTTHDTASYVLQQSLARIKYLATAPNQSNGVAEQAQYLTFSLRASVVLSDCWVIIGCGNVLSRIELVVSASNYAVQLQKMSSKGVATVKYIQTLRDHLQDVVAILRDVYDWNTVNCDSSSGTLCTEVRRVARDTSSEGYVRILYAKATANLSTIN